MQARVVAIDWSGAMAGASRKIWLAEVKNRSLLRPESGRNREQIAEYLIKEAGRTPYMVVGLDFAFSLPAASNEDAFDAAVSALVMAQHLQELVALEPTKDPVIAREGFIWYPRAAG